MKSTVTEEFFRVTSIRHLSGQYSIFSGLPLKPNSYRVNDGKYIVCVTCETERLPVHPAKGQQWRVKGLQTLDMRDIGDYQLQQHSYDSPLEMECTLPETGEGLIGFIAQEKVFRGIGEAKARTLWDSFGVEIHALLQRDNTENRMRLQGLLTTSAVDSLYRGYARYQNLSHANWMAGIGIPLSVQQRILKYHDEKSVEALRANPYNLMGFGLSFDESDAIAKKLGVTDCDDSRRLSAAVEFAIRKQVAAGHTYTSHKAIRPTVHKLLGDTELTNEALLTAYQNAQFIVKGATGTYHPVAQLIMESVVAKRLASLVQQAPQRESEVSQAIQHALDELPYRLTYQQLRAVQTSVARSVSCVTGGAGTGKTTILRTVFKVYHELGFAIHAVALSGRAAMRLHEATGFITTTIARFLREGPVTPTEEQPHHLLVIDEASMIDLPTMYRLVTHLDPSVRILLSGDPNQLPPIGCGKVLSDVVESAAIPDTPLNIVQRQESSTGIPEYSMSVNRGEMPRRLTTGAVTFHETSKDQMVLVCEHLYAQSAENSQVIGATKRMVADINNRCQALRNPDGERLQFIQHGEQHYLDFREGDPILFTKNNYNIGVQNGSLGILTSVEPDEESYGVVTLNTGERILITDDVLDYVELGYCMTLHKAQGSQFPRIIMALQPGRIVDRAWLYTAITRAESEVHIVGSSKDFACITQSNSNANRRNSYLRTLLEEDKAQPPWEGG